TFTNVAASVQGDKVFTDRTDIPLRPGDQISRTTPAGVEEEFIIEDPGFHSGGGDLPDTYQMRVRPHLPQPRRPNDPIPDNSEELERDIDYWTDQLAECSGGSERAYQIDARLKRLARAKERVMLARQGGETQQTTVRDYASTGNRAEMIQPHSKSPRIEKTVFI